MKLENIESFRARGIWDSAQGWGLLEVDDRTIYWFLLQEVMNTCCTHTHTYSNTHIHIGTHRLVTVEGERITRMCGFLRNVPLLPQPRKSEGERKERGGKRERKERVWGREEEKCGRQREQEKDGKINV